MARKGGRISEQDLERLHGCGDAMKHLYYAANTLLVHNDGAFEDLCPATQSPLI